MHEDKVSLSKENNRGCAINTCPFILAFVHRKHLKKEKKVKKGSTSCFLET